ncbi:MAG TPA: ERF family protein, partial [Bacteroidia bacterium]|nr:ERF family protein [Bacteroidia bacterium]
TAFAREPESKKGMDESQITGASSSYARKYALNGLFAIDDNKDADTMDNTNGSSKPELKPGSDAWDKAEKYMSGGGSIDTIKKKYQLSKENEKALCNSIGTT